MPFPDGEPAIRLSQIVSSLSHALDLTEGQPIGHSVRSCLLGMTLAEMVGFSPSQRADLYYALLLKDIGCSSVAARICSLFGGNELDSKSRFKTVDWTDPVKALQFIYQISLPGAPVHQRGWRAAGIALRSQRYSDEVVDIRCHRGATIVGKMGFSAEVGRAILCLDEHWNGQGKPQKLRGEDIPPLARILCVSQTLEVFLATSSVKETRDMLRKRRGRWFEPALTDAALELINNPELLEDLRAADVNERIMELEPAPISVPADGQRLDDIADAFAEVIDAKSPYTSTHSVGVTQAALGIAMALGLPEEIRPDLRRAALLHDIGKLGVPNSILDKPGKLTPDEWVVMRRHPEYTFSILDKSGAFADLAAMAAAHHEKLDGSGYPNGLRADELSVEARILAVADIYDALSARRPYRDALPWSEVQRIISAEAGDKLCPEAFRGLCVWHSGL